MYFKLYLFDIFRWFEKHNIRRYIVYNIPSIRRKFGQTNDFDLVLFVRFPILFLYGEFIST